jgi:hypothetical protein
MITEPLDFIHLFITFADSEGIYDKYDKESNKMVTSPGMTNLIKLAREFFPQMPKGVPAAMMRDLTNEERSKAIAGSPDKVIDMRAHFAAEMQQNGSARGLLQQLAAASEAGNLQEIRRITDMAKTFNKYQEEENDAG